MTKIKISFSVAAVNATELRFELGLVLDLYYTIGKEDIDFFLL